jgi:hypothetical protein
MSGTTKPSLAGDGERGLRWVRCVRLLLNSYVRLSLSRLHKEEDQTE